MGLVHARCRSYTRSCLICVSVATTPLSQVSSTKTRSHTVRTYWHIRKRQPLFEKRTMFLQSSENWRGVQRVLQSSKAYTDTRVALALLCYVRFSMDRMVVELWSVG